MSTYQSASHTESVRSPFEHEGDSLNNRTWWTGFRDGQAGRGENPLLNAGLKPVYDMGRQAGQMQARSQNQQVVGHNNVSAVYVPPHQSGHQGQQQAWALATTRGNGHGYYGAPASPRDPSSQSRQLVAFAKDPRTG